MDFHFPKFPSYSKAELLNEILSKPNQCGLEIDVDDIEQKQKLLEDKVKEAEKYRHEIKQVRDEYTKLENDISDDSPPPGSRRLFEDVSGEGKKRMDKHGLSNFQIDAIMAPFKKRGLYLGTIAHNEIDRILPLIKPHSVGGFVCNTDPNTLPGAHWQAVYFNGKPNGSIEFYDSFGDRPDKVQRKWFKLISAKLQPTTPIKVKINRVQNQANSSANCGFFACKFLMDKFNGKHFEEASNWNQKLKDEHIVGEEAIEKYKKQMGYGPWKFIKSAAQKVYDVGKEVVSRAQKVIFGRVDAPPAVQRLVDSYGQQTIQSITVGRTPINSTIKGLLNAISLGQFSANQKKLGYSDVFHLYMIIKLANGHSFKLEKNADVSVGSASLGEGSSTISVPMNKVITLHQFIENGTKDKSIFHYSHDSRNCQHFVTTMLRSSGLLTSEISSFVNQDAAKLVANLPITNAIGRTVTDIAQKIGIIFGGKLKKKSAAYI